MGEAERSAASEPVFEVGFHDRLPWWENTVLAIQNILGMTGMFLFPGVMGAVFKLPPQQIAQVYGATFVTCGLVTVLQGTFILRLPIVMGPFAGTFAAILAAGQARGLDQAYGSLFVAALIWAAVSVPVGRGALVGTLAQLFREPLIYASVLLIAMAQLVTITLANWVGTPNQPGFGLANWVGGLVCVVAIVLALAFARGILRRGAMLWGIILGSIAYAAFRPLSFAPVASIGWLYVPTPFPFGFGVSADLVVVFFLMLMASSAGALAHYQMVSVWGDEAVSSTRMSAGVFSESLGAAVAAVTGTFSTASYPDCLGILKASRVGSLLVTVTAGAILIVLGCVLKFDALFVVIPSNVIAAAATVMFGIVFVSAIEMLGRVAWTPKNSIVLGLSFMFSLGGLFVDNATLSVYPMWARSVVGQPVLTGTVLVVVLHLLLNKLAPAVAQRRQAPLPMEPSLPAHA